jgi:NitT/TauT family transport system substrate-binding protein
MIKKSLHLLLSVILFAALLPSAAIAVDTYRIAWSHYTGWEPWDYARQSGILDKWSSKYGIRIQLDLINDYIESINLYTGGAYQGCVMTNMDALTIPAVGGVDSTALILGDFSNGNDGIVMKNSAGVTDLKGREVKLVELSVSHYLLARALAMNALQENDVKLMNTSDADIAAVFAADKNGAVVTWNPPLMQCRNVKDAKLVFDSSQIPGEIIDMMVVRSDAPDALKKALVGAWFETMAVISSKSKAGKEAVEYMANVAGGTVAEFKAQLRTTAMFYTPAEAVAFATSDQLKKTMAYVSGFSFEHGLFGDAENKDVVGISFPDGSVQGAESNIRLRFDAGYMKMAADGKL